MKKLGPLGLDSSIPSITILPKNTFFLEVFNSLMFSFVGIIFVFFRLGVDPDIQSQFR